MAGFNVSKFVFPLFAFSTDIKPRFLGNAFAVTPNGGLLTCRHVVDNIRENETLSVVQPNSETAERNYRIPKGFLFPASDTWDIAYIPDALQMPHPEYFPIISPEQIFAGTRAYTFGSFSIGRRVEDLESAYFAGEIASKRRNEDQSVTVTLPFPILEGLSGSPILSYNNGVKVVGLAYGNRETRIVRAQSIELDEDGRQTRETINRYVEFGLAYGPETIIQALQEMCVADHIVTDGRVDISGLPA